MPHLSSKPLCWMLVNMQQVTNALVLAIAWGDCWEADCMAACLPCGFVRKAVQDVTIRAFEQRLGNAACGCV